MDLPESAAEVKLITQQELEKHTLAADCWVAISGKVYDVTHWLEHHPGGHLTLLDVAGHDATDVFKAMHPDYVMKMLPRFQVGVLETADSKAMVEDFRKLKKEVEDMGLTKNDPVWYANKGAVLLAVFLVIVAGVNSGNRAIHMFCALLMGMWWNQVNFIGHDAGHNGITGNAKKDNAIGVLVGNMLTGISMAWWKRTHNVHHIVCNSADYDPDIQHMPLFAISPRLFSNLFSFYHFRKMTFDWIACLLVGYQHLTFYPIMAVARINLYIQSLLLLFSSQKVNNRMLEIGGIVFFWAWFGAMLSCLPSTWERVLFFAISHAMTGLLHVQICASHFPMPVFEGKPDPVEWFKVQAEGTLDIECSPWLDWFHGGLQFQLEHHLFPRVPRKNLRKISAPVKSFCLKHDIPYNSLTFWEANVSVVQTLKRAAMVARKRSTDFSDSYIWQAMNIIG